MSLVHLIRHGEPLSGWGEPQGSPDPGLSPLGLSQAEAAAEHLFSLAAEERPERVLTSPLLRCRQTAEPLAARLNVPPEIEPAVAEIPTPMDIPAKDRASWLRGVMGGRWSDIHGFDGEAWRRAVVASLLRAGGAAVFTHFVAINAAVSAAQGSSSVLVFRPAPASITTLRVQASGLVVVRLAEALAEEGRVL